MALRDFPAAPPRHVLSDGEAVTLRRLAFGESDQRVLRRPDIDRLLSLGLIAATGGELILTVSGRTHFDSLPLATFASKPGRLAGW